MDFAVARHNAAGGPVTPRVKAVARALVAFGAALLATSAAVADCGEAADIVLLRGDLPVSADAPNRVKASLALPYAAMLAFVPGSGAPPGFARGPGPTELLPNEGGRLLAALTDFNAATFVSCDGRAVVIAFQGLRNFHVTDYLRSGLRRVGGGYSVLALDLTAAVIAAYPEAGASVIGHSAGGNLASFAAGAFGLPSITFNASPTLASRTWNDGSRQLNVIVRGDLIADHDALPGTTLYIDAEGSRTHQLDVILAGLADEAAR
ncbi:MAG: hypothetical protein ACWA6X_11380 [Bauldia sp.]